MKKHNATRAFAFLLALLSILSLSSCFAGVGEVTTGADEELPSIVTEYDHAIGLSNGIELTLSADGAYYSVTDGAACTSSTVVIPESFNGIPVEVIQDLNKNEIIETLILPESIIRIYDNAFYYCPNLKYTEYGNAKYLGSAENKHIALIKAANTAITSVEIHPQTVIIADDAFADCKSLTNVTFGNLLKSIGAGAFSDLDSLKNVEIPDSVNCLGKDAFFSCDALERVVIGNGIEEIPYRAFERCTSLTEVEFGSSVRVLGEYAFANCTALPYVRLPGTVDTVDTRTFESCDSLKYNYYGKELRYLPGENSEYEYLVSFVYYSFEKADLHPDTRVIANKAFGILKNLKELSIDGEGRYLTSAGNCIIDKESGTLVAGINTSVIPDDGSIKEIGDYAFYNMREFRMTSLPSGINRIGNSAFAYCMSLECIELNPELVSVGDSAFEDCGLSTVSFGDMIETIGNNAFSFNSITELYLPSSLRELGDDAFRCNEKLVSLEIDEGLTEIGQYVFGDCWELKNVTLPSTLESIGTGAFYSCTLLESIVLPENLKYIGRSAFLATELKDIILPEGLLVIEEQAFKSGDLESVKVNSGIVRIGRDAFACRTLKSVSYGGTAAEWQEFTGGVYDMFWEGDVITVECSDGDLECLGVMNIPSSAWD